MDDHVAQSAKYLRGLPCRLRAVVTNGLLTHGDAEERKRWVARKKIHIPREDAPGADAAANSSEVRTRDPNHR
jgi:hypothetical protein